MANSTISSNEAGQQKTIDHDSTTNVFVGHNPTGCDEPNKRPRKRYITQRATSTSPAKGFVPIQRTANDSQSSSPGQVRGPTDLTTEDVCKYNHNTLSTTATQLAKKVPRKRGRLVTLIQIGKDWLYLASLGIIMALLSFSMDTVIALFLNTKVWLSHDLSEDNPLVQYLGWCIMPVVLVTFSSGFVHLCSPTAIGSGIPEMKTILRGVVLNEYLTFRTLIAKIVGLTFTLGSGLPLGKEGPFVHMASIVATLLSKLVASFQGIYENESRTSEMLSAACAVGVAATFYAPIGGVLFSIEVTTVYFAVRNYWRGFFAACCGATIWRLLGFWIKNDESISALFKTNFRTDYPFDPIELLVFSFIGGTCGLAGAAYIKFHREIVQFFRRHKKISGFLQKNRFVYPIFVTLVITTVTFPPLMGKYTASTLSTHTTIEHLFSNRTWSLGHQDLESRNILEAWTTESTSFHLHLVLYIGMLFWTSALASTIPIPSGLFIPVLKMGAAYGRLIGELMHTTFPNGIKYGEYAHPASIVPGSYAVVGAAAFSGAVTHTISTSVILFEMTGQIVHIIPVILGVLIANAVCQSLQPSIYDSIIEIKKLPYLPPIASSNSVSHKVLVKDFMNTNLAYVWKEKCSYNDLKNLLTEHKKIISFPLVESPHSMKLLGSVARPDLLKLLYLHLGRERRLQEVYRRNSDTLSPNVHLLNTLSGRIVSDTKKQPAASITSNNLQMQLAIDRGLELQFNVGKGGQEISTSSLSSINSSSDSNSPEMKPPTHLLKIPEVERPVITKWPAPRQGGNDMPLSSSSENEEESNKSDALDRTKVIAKIINHYNRGSYMDDDFLEKSSQEITERIRDLTNKTPEVVVVSVETDQNKLPAPALPSANLRKTLVPVAEARPVFDFISLNGNNLSPPSQQRTPMASPSPGGRPKKSILKSSSTTASMNNFYKRNISAASFSNTFGAMDHSTGKSAGLPSQGSVDNNSQPIFNIGGSTQENGSSSTLACLNQEQAPVRQRRKVRLPRLRVVDMTAEEQEQWEEEQLSAYIDISKCQIDEAPFQLVEQTSLYRVHTLFSMLGLNHAYVTSFGRLVGIVALKDIRFALEKVLQE